MQPKTFQQILDDMMQPYLGNPQQQLGPQQGQGGLTIGTSSGGILTPSQLTQMLQGLSAGISQQEKQELENLRQQNKLETKTLRLMIFKKLPGDLRQYVINSFIWKESVGEMNKTVADKTERQKELENKESLSNMFGQGVHISSGSSFSIDPQWITGVALPEGITIEDLKQAHVEACLEEEVLDGEQE